MSAENPTLKECFSGNEAADVYGVPFSILKNLLGGRVIQPEHHHTFEESELLSHFLTPSSIVYGKTM